MGKKTTLFVIAVILAVSAILLAVFAGVWNRSGLSYSRSATVTDSGAVPESVSYTLTDRDLNGQCEIPKDRCFFSEPLSGLSESPDASLRKLSSYQDFCKSSLSDEMMLFVPFPTDTDLAADYADSLAKKLDVFSSAGIVPVVLMEPSNDRGMVSLSKIADGTYDEAVSAFFIGLKTRGVTDDSIGIWIPYPEANTPSWDRKGFVEASFPKMERSFFASLHKSFPDAETGILLNSRSYDSSDTNWERPRSDSFSDYLDGIPKGSVDIFAIQGFPWLPPSGDRSDPLTDPTAFLNPENAAEAAKKLGVSSVWVHTGTFRTMYAGTNDSVSVSATDRERILRSILEVTERIGRKAGIDAVLSLFASDKSKSAEAIDWSYDLGSGSEDSYLRDIIREAFCDGIRVSVFGES